MKKILKYKRQILYIAIALTVILLNVFAWRSRRFCDAYIAHIFPVWINTYGRFSGLFPFSVGEWLLVLGVILVVLAVILLPAAGIGAAISATKRIKGIRQKNQELAEDSFKSPAPVEDRVRRRRDKAAGKMTFLNFCIIYYRIFAWIVVIVCLIMTLNCFILYHASTFTEKYFNAEEAEYELADVMRLRNEIVMKCNELSRQMDRDEDGRIVYPGSALSNGKISDSGMQDKAREAMRNLGKGISNGEQAANLRPYAQLDGYYPRPKALFFSDFMCQQYMQGYYFPFSMEANYNDVMYVMNKPFTMCHELAHLRGFIYEDEANFIGYLACVQSDDLYFQYSGYLCAFSYLQNDLYKARQNAPNAYEAALSVAGLVAVEEQVYADNIFVEQKEWDRINANALISTETVDKAADVFIDTNLKVNGIEDGALSYSRMVKLLMLYYPGA